MNPNLAGPRYWLPDEWDDVWDSLPDGDAVGRLCSMCGDPAPPGSLLCDGCQDDELWGEADLP